MLSIEREGEPARRLELGLAGSAQRLAGRLADPRRPPQQEVARGAVRSRRRRSRARPPTSPSSKSAACVILRPDPVERHDARVGAARRRSRLQVDGPAPRSTATTSPTAQRERLLVGRACLAGRVVQLAAAEVVLLRREAVPPDLLALRVARRAARPARAPPIGSSSSTSCSGVEVHQPVELPPDRLVLAPVPAQELGQQPAACCSGVRSAGSVGTTSGPARRSTRAWTRASSRSDVLRAAARRADAGRGTSRPVSVASSTPRPSSQSRSCRLLTTSSRL